MLKRKLFVDYSKYILLYFMPLVLLSGIISYTIYKQEIRTFYAVMENNESQILEFQQRLITEHLKGLEEDINYLQNFSRTSEFINSDFNPKIDLSRIFGSFLKRKKIYSSVSIIDSGGFERFRMNFDGPGVTKVSKKDLQSKGSRYYFHEIMSMNPEDIYYSHLDFNYEEGKLQFPYKPVLRVSKLLLDKAGDKRAFIILNYRGSDIIKLINKSSVYSYGKIFLQNDEGLIISTDASISLEKSAIMDFLETDSGKEFFNKTEGQININSGYLTYKKIKIVKENYSQKITLISFIDRYDIGKHTKNDFQRGIFIFLFLSFLSLIISFFIAKNTIQKIKTNLIIQERAKIFDYNPAPVLKVSESGEILSSNIAAKKILGLTKTPPSIFKVFKILNKKDISNSNLSDIDSFEYQIDKKTYFFTYIKETTNKQIFFYGTDITANYKTREDLKNFQTAVKQSANVIVFTDLEGKLLFANDAFEKVTGYSSEELLGNKTSILNSGYHNNSFYEDLWDTINNGNVWTGEFYNKRKDGSFYWEKATITPVLAKNKKPKFFIAVKEDITQTKGFERELKEQKHLADQARITAEKAQMEAESANSLKSTFLANMSHEIRTPMNAILGFTRLLLEKEIYNKDREMLSIIFNSGENLLALINDILDFSKIEANEIELTLVKINLVYFFESIEDLFKIQSSQKNLKFEVDIPNTIPEIVFGDENRIRQILINVIGNAIKFTENGGISIKVDWIDNNLVIKIIDSGIGIHKDKLVEIFSPFKQSDSHTGRKYQGTGLGLAISQKFTHLMGGEITVTSKLDKGSTFIIELPLDIFSDKIPFSSKDSIEKDNIRNSELLVQSWLNKVKYDNILNSIVKDAITNLPRQLRRLGTEIEARNYERIEAVSHELKGSTGNLGMTELYELFSDINNCIRDNTDFSEIVNIYNNLKSIIDNIPLEYMEETASSLLEVDGDTININILTADDSSVNRLLIEAMLSKIYIKTDFAENGKEVLEKLKTKKYNILLLDIQMPVLDGTETIKAIRENKEYSSLHVIAVTANAMKGDAKRYLELGCNDYISKPIQKELFLKKIEHQIQIISNNSPELNLLPDNSEIDNIISDLEKESKIFNVSRVKNIALKLEKYKSNKQILIIIKKLESAAESFDSKGLNKIIKLLMEIKDKNAKE